MTINHGKRNPGGLTAASPGDTLYIPFATHNDSGASIGIGGTLAVTDIEIFKSGAANVAFVAGGTRWPVALQQYSAGGSGGANRDVAAGVTGGDRADGICVVIEFIA